MHPPKFTVGDDYITIPPIRMVNWTADKTAACVLLRKQTTRHVCSFYFSSVKYQVYIHFQNKYQLGGSSIRPLLGLRPWTPLGDFRPQDTFPFASNHQPKVTELLTPLVGYVGIYVSAP